jgi:N-methylhydantoinase A/oxoprolinase/acetone carboxylase beta subunit
MCAEIASKLAEVDASAPKFDLALGLGYVGQSYHVPVNVPVGGIGALTAEELRRGFAGTYRAKYGYYYDDVPVELVNVHVTGTAGRDIGALPELPEAIADDSGSAVRGERDAYSAKQRRFLTFKVYNRSLLRRGMSFTGPCLIEEDAATTVVDAGARVTVDRYGSLDIDLGEE